MNSTVCQCDQLLFDVTAQNAHWLAGALAVVAIGVLAGKCSTVYTFVVGMALAAIKEFVWDQLMESDCDRGSNLEDFGFYCLGLVVGVLVNLFLPGSMDPRKLCFCDRSYEQLSNIKI